MSFEIKLALKYFRTKRRSLVRFTSAAAVIGITVGVTGLIIAQALAVGFQNEMREKILANTAHISIFRTDGGEISDWQKIKEELEKNENIKEISATHFENSFLVSNNSANFAVLRVNSKLNLRNSETTKINVAVGKQLAEKSSLKIGDEAEIFTFKNETETERTKITIAEIFETGLYDYDLTWIYISPEDFARIYHKHKFIPTNLSISVKDIYRSDRTAQEIPKALGENFKVVDWQEANRPLFAALSLERKVSLAVVSLIVFIATLNIATTLALLVNERRLDIAVLRTCGVKTTNLIKIFLFEGLFLSLTGIFCGVFLGLLSCFLGNYFKLVSISPEVYALNYIPFYLQVSDILLIVSFVFLVCLLACAYPALRASRIKPLENLRTQ
jgi:lipoprotein-releasing system permease protein